LLPSSLMPANKNSWEPTRAYLVRGLEAVSARLEPKEAAEVAAALSQAISKSTDPHVLTALGLGLLVVSARLEPKEAGRVRGELVTLIQTMNKPTHAAAVRHLAAGLSASLSAASARLEPKEARRPAHPGHHNNHGLDGPGASGEGSARAVGPPGAAGGNPGRRHSHPGNEQDHRPACPVGSGAEPGGSVGPAWSRRRAARVVWPGRRPPSLRP